MKMWINIILAAMNLVLGVVLPVSYATPINFAAVVLCSYGAYDSYLFNKRIK